MTVNEMHIAVNLGVQKIASFQADNLLPQEIDHELNLAMLRFIKQRYSPLSNRIGKGFEQSQKRIDDLRALVVEGQGNTFNVGAAYDDLGSYVYTSNFSNIYVDRFTLPLDYLFLVSVRAEVNYVCNTSILPYYDPGQVFFDGIKVSLTPPAPGYVLSGIDWGVAGIWNSIINNPTGLGTELLHDTWIDSSYYNFGLTPSINFPSEGALNASAHTSPTLDSDHFYISANTTIWELLDGGYIRTTWTLNGDMGSALYKIESERRQWMNTQRYADATTRLSLCKYAQHDDIIYMQDDPFNRVDYRSPLYTIEENFIDIHTDDTFVVPKVNIKYVRTPVAISKLGGVGCELPEHTHPEIVEMAVKSILEGIESPRYQSQSFESLESE
jgi:hypothetical protein